MLNRSRILILTSIFYLINVNYWMRSYSEWNIGHLVTWAGDVNRAAVDCCMKTYSSNGTLVTKPIGFVPI